MPSIQLIQIPAAGGMMPAHLASAGTSHAPGVVLLQEIFGVNANMREIAADYAARGFHAVVPDLFWRQESGVELDPERAEDRERAVQLMKGLDTPLAVDDVLAAVRRLRAMCWAVGAVGYCLGGKLAYLAAASGKVDAAVSYYGVAIQEQLHRASDIAVPLLLHIAEEDHLCPAAAQLAIEAAFESNDQVEVVRYPETGHAFARRGSSSFRSEAAARADLATADFLEARLARMRPASA